GVLRSPRDQPHHAAPAHQRGSLLRADPRRRAEFPVSKSARAVDWFEPRTVYRASHLHPPENPLIIPSASMSTSWPIPRRTFLRGLGTAVALPVLDAMLPSRALGATAMPNSAFPKRLAWIYVPNGKNMEDW